MLSRRLLVLSVAGCFALLNSAQAQQRNVAAAQQPASTTPAIAGNLLSDGFEIKAQINNTYLILQKGNQAYWCGSANPNLTWTTWPTEMRDAPCTALNK